MQEKKERFHGIPMLPYGLLSAVMQESPGNRKEIQITEMAEGGFCFRTASAICSPQKLEVCFYDMERAEYGTVVITEFEICREKEEDFFYAVSCMDGAGRVSAAGAETCAAVQQIYPAETGR